MISIFDSGFLVKSMFVLCVKKKRVIGYHSLVVEF